MDLPKSAGVIDFWNAADVGETRDDFGISEGRINLFVKPFYDVRECVLQCDHAIPHACLVAMYKLTDRRKFWRCLRMRLTGHCESTEPARLV
jgi:hypothetical protein